MTGTPDGSAPTAPSPIADLSYRRYDGPLHTRAARWWIVALAGIRQLRKNTGFWVMTGLAALPFFVQGAQYYFLPIGPNQDFARQFHGCFTGQQLMLFVLTLMIGTGSIAADNRANALLIYLSRPLTKGDYLLGKWMGVFLVLFAIGAVPALALSLYCVLSFPGAFFKAAPWLIGRMLLAAAVPAALHASLALACSAWSKTPRLAGAFYAGLFFISAIVVNMIADIRFGQGPNKGALVRSLSIDGLIRGLGEHIYGIERQIPRFGGPPPGMAPDSLMPPAPMPSLWALAAVAAGLVALGVLATRAKIRAVEVVRG